MAKINKCFPYRPHDYMYDPLFTVSGPTDHYKAAIIAKMSTAKFQICPIFPNMFSDLPHYPRKQYLRCKTSPIPEYVDQETQKRLKIQTAVDKKVDVAGADRYQFYKCPIIEVPGENQIPYQTVTTFNIKRVKPKSKKKVQNQNVAVMTKFREEEAQTIPWEPPFKVKGEGEPEVLTLDYLKWGDGLPAGQHEVELIERARMKRAWEKALKPEKMTQQFIDNLRAYMEAVELDEWAFREKEIQTIQDMRMELLEKMLNEIHEKSTIRTEQKMKKIIDRAVEEKEAKLKKIRNQTQRALRKIELAERGQRTDYHKVGVIEEYVSRKSEIYAPLMRHGEHPQRWHMVIDERMRKYRAQFIGVESISTLPVWLDKATMINEREIDAKVKTRHLCMRESKWTQPVLKELHEELRNLRTENPRKQCSLMKKIEKKEVISNTPEVEGITEEEESEYQAIIMMQSILRGRASQMLMEKLKESADNLRSSNIGTVLNFLNQELRRLLLERKAHAICLSLERDLRAREAAEAGRRQYELARRKVNDEMFKQIIKMHQDTVDLYLQDIISEGMDFVSTEQATCYIKDLANKVEQETEELYTQSEEIKGDESMIAELVHHFVLPEVDKLLVREKIQTKQKETLRTVHDSIYGKFETVPGQPKSKKETFSESFSLMGTGESEEEGMFTGPQSHDDKDLNEDIMNYLREVEIHDGVVEGIDEAEENEQIINN